MNTEKVFYSVKEAAAKTGLSQKFIRSGLEDKSIPYVKSGNKYMINLPLWMEGLDRESGRPSRR